MFYSRYCIRTPLWSLDRTTDYLSSKEDLREFWNDPVINEAVFLASPELYSALERALEADVKVISSRLTDAFLKYLLRITSRCTPFGLFAGCTVGTFSDTTHIELASINTYQRQTRFDMNFVVAWSQKLAKLPIIKKQLKWFPNNSIYKIGNQYRYMEYKYTKNNIREHSLEGVAYSKYLENILINAKKGATISSLASSIINDEVTHEDALWFIEKLIDNQILVSELEPTITGNDFLEQIYHILTKLNHTEDTVKHIESLTNLISNLDNCIGNSTKKYHRIHSLIKNKNSNVALKYLFQTDLYPKTIRNELNYKWGYKLKRLLTVLNKINGSKHETRLKKFIEAFSKRYETREIPLTTALDVEIGIGYPLNQRQNDSIQFLEGFDLPSQSFSEQHIVWNSFQERLLQKMGTLDHVLTLTDDDFLDLEARWDDLPDTMALMVELVNLQGEEKLAITSVGGSSATNLLGRFTTGNQQINEFVKEITAYEQTMNPDYILAELVHLPDSRTGNVIRRTQLRTYEIPYLGKSSMDHSKQISVDDLMLSVRGEKMYLRSKIHNKFIFPRLSNAHNYSSTDSLPIYQFLCDFQHQGLRTSLGFNWGSVLKKRGFLPRVVYKDFILAKARWRITSDEIKELKEVGEEERIQKISQWRTKLKLPVQVQLVEGDHTLYINLENNESISMWVRTVDSQKDSILEEFLFTEDTVVKRGKERLAHQMIICLYNEDKLKKNHTTQKKGD